MDTTTKKLFEFLQKGEPELRCSAALLIGELKPKGRKTFQLLGDALQDSNPNLRRIALNSLQKIGGKEIQPHLLGVIRRGGPEGEQAAAAMAATGALGMKILMKELQSAAPSVKKAIAGGLSRSGTKAGADTALRSLMDPNPEVVNGARRSLEAQAQKADPTERKKLAKKLIEALSKKEAVQRPAALGAGIRVLEILREPSAEKLLWKWAGNKFPDPIRAAALRALVKGSPPKGQVQQKILVGFLQEKDPTVVQPALELLGRSKVPAPIAGKIIPQLDSPAPSVRVQAMRALRNADGMKAADAVLARLHHPDPEMRQVAEQVCSSLPAARKSLAKELLKCKDVSQAWGLVRILRRQTGGIDPATMKSLCERALDAIVKDQPWQEPIVHFAKNLEAKKFGTMLRKKAAQLRRGKKFKEVVRCLRLLTRDSDFSVNDRFELALAGLILSPKKTDAHSRSSDRCLPHFLNLSSVNGFSLFSRLKKERVVGAPEFYYVGFHLAERGDRKTAEQILKHIAKKWPRSPSAKLVKKNLLN